MMEVHQSFPPSALPWIADREVLTVLDQDGRPDPTRDPRLEAGLVRKIYDGMLRTRLIDARLTKLQRQGRIGFHVGAEGEEAAIVAAAAAMRAQDWLFPCYREVGAALFRGFPLQAYIDNMYGNANDLAKGRQMPDHITARDAHFGSVTAPIGTQITQAVGFSWAAKIKKEDLVAGVFFGDGATSSNDFHSGMNFAGVFRTPTVFLLRNNGWAISVPSEHQTASRTYADKGLGYGVQAVRCDGNDALAVYSCVQKAVQRAAAGEGPTLVELITYRAGAHSTNDDPTVYRDKAEVDRQLKRDPIKRLRKYLELFAGYSEADEKRLTDEVHAELQACVERAEAAAPPTLASMFEQVFESMPPHLQEQQRESQSYGRSAKSH
jgi:2-oxoisovalerate dehydrogenase E1 component alpha subunit